MRSGEEDGGGNPAPQSTITSVSDGDGVSGFVNVIGTAAAPDFATYSLSYRRIDETTYKTILNSTTAVTNGALGKWDTTLLENDNYVLKLEVLDTFGSFSAVEVEVSVTGNLKLGNFRLSFEDMTIPVAGIPITIVRTYDTLRADRDGDFGYGWRLEYRNTDLRTSLPKSGLEDIGIYSPFKAGAKVFLTLPGGQRQGFTFTPEIKFLPGFGPGNDLVLAFPRFTPDKGVTSQLSAGGGSLIVNEFGELYAAGGMPWNPASPDFNGYTLTNADGTRFKIDGRTGFMTSAVDLSGNRVMFSDDGVSGSAGNTRIEFRKDTSGRIRSIIDPSGNSTEYAYSASGELESTTDRDGNVTAFFYSPLRQHFLDRVVDPLGRVGIRADYDQLGRLVTTTDVSGLATRISYELNSRLVTTRNPLNQATIAEYDLLGNVVAVTHPGGGVNRYGYDSNGNLSTESDAMGNVTRYDFDRNGNLLGLTDPMGHTAYYSYSAFGNVSSITDPIGRTIHSKYDEKGRLIQFSDAAGRSVQSEFDHQGNLTRVNDPLGRTSLVSYDAAGRRLRTTDPTGAKINYQYNSVGYLSSQSTNESEVAFKYSKEGLATGLVRNGVERSVTYDAAGRVISASKTANPTGTFEYDKSDRLVAVKINGSNNFDVLVHDAVGNLVTQSNEFGSRQHEYNADSKLIKTVYSDGTTEKAEYDLAGRLTRTIDRRGGTTQYAYDAAGRRIRVVGPMGGVQSFVYDAAGQLTSSIDPDGNITQYEYDQSGLVSAIVDGTVRKTVSHYDLAGRLTSTTDAAFRTTKYEYDDADRLVLVRDPIGAETKYAYSSFGLASIVYPNGSSSTTEYDSAGRPVRFLQPNGIAEVKTYDEDGVQTSTSSGGKTVSYFYDESYQLSRLTTSDGESETYAYTTDV